jgi:hypothetical protein
VTADSVLFFAGMLEATRLMPVSEINMERLQAFSESANLLVTVDAPLFGCVLIFCGRLLSRGTEPDKIGQTPGYPSPKQVIMSASRFWIQHHNGIRECKTRDEMAQILAGI